MKKVLSMLLVAAMLLACLVGCGQKKVETNESNQTSQAKSSTEQESEPSSSEEVVEEPTTVTWVIRNDPQEDDAKVLEAVNKLLRERYNLELNLIAIPGGEYNEKCRMMIMGGEEFDLMFTANWTNKFIDNVNQEAFLPLNDLLETEVGQELLSVYPEGHYEVARVNGNVYALPNYQICYSQNAFYIQKDLADKYNLGLKTGDRIENVYEIEDFITAIRDNEEDIWPLRYGGSYHDFVYNKDKKVVEDVRSYSSIYADDKDLKVFFSLDNPEWLEGYKKLNQLYKDGFFRSDVATVVDDSADMKANRYAIHMTTGKPSGEVSVSNNQGEEYIMVYVDSVPTKAATAGTDTMTAINVNSKNPEAALKMYAAFWLDEEIFNTFLYGIEGEHYTKVSENRVEQIADSGYNRSGCGWMVGNNFNQWLMPGQEDGVWEETEAINRSAVPAVLTGFTFNTEPVSTEIAQISTVAGEYSNQFLYADDVDAWYKEFYDKLKAAGVDKVVEEAQKQIDAWAAANGKK